MFSKESKPVATQNILGVRFTVSALDQLGSDHLQVGDRIQLVRDGLKAKAAVESLRTQFREAGWKEDVASVTGMSGVVSVSREGGPSATITYSDTGFLPTELSVSAMRAELEAAR